MARLTGNGDGPLDPDRSTARLFVDGYGNGRFRIAGEEHIGSIIVFPEIVLPWPVTDLAEATIENFADFAEHASETDLLLLGTGPRMLPVPAVIRESAHSVAVTVEVMDTGAAARTYNVLLAEDRRVAVALIAV